MLANLGREDGLDVDGLRRLVGSMNRYLGDPEAGAGDVAEVAGDGLSVVGSRPAGTALAAIERDDVVARLPSPGPRRHSAEQVVLVFV